MKLTIVPFAADGIALNDVAERVAHSLASLAAESVETRIAVPQWDPAEAYDASRGQYRARKFLERLPAAPADGVVLGLTALDLFIPIFTFVFGEGILGGRRCVVSGLRRAARPGTSHRARGEGSDA
jgi:archaemetzincin